MLVRVRSERGSAGVAVLFQSARPDLEGRFFVLSKLGKETLMGWFSFLFTVRFWVLAWLVILFMGLTPVPPTMELLIVGAFLSHFSWYAHRRIRRAALARALTRAERAEEAEFRRLHRRRPPPGEGPSLTTVGPVSWH